MADDTLVTTADTILGLSPEASQAAAYVAGRMPQAPALTTKLVGIALVPEVRREFEACIDARNLTAEDWNPRSQGYDEVVVGSGYTAAVYCSIRKRLGKPVGLVVEAKDHIGGEFAMTREPSFWTNSRNRPGELDIPGSGGALNVIPDGIVQPAMLSDAEFLPNTDIAYAIRCSLMASAQRVVTGVTAEEVVDYFGKRKAKLRATTRDGRGVDIHADRVIDARGLGSSSVTTSENVMPFNTFMRHMTTERAPLRGIKRLAIVGGGDSARCAIEAACGMSPAKHWSVPWMDYVERIVAYARGWPTNCLAWRAANRSRYQQMASLIETRVEVQNALGDVRQGYGCAFVNAKPYDLVVTCVGPGPSSSLQDDQEAAPTLRNANIPCGRGNDLLCRAGVAARLAFDTFDPPEVQALSANLVAMFRQGQRIGLLASKLA